MPEYDSQGGWCALLRYDVSRKDAFGLCAIHHACAVGNAGMVQILMEHKADVLDTTHEVFARVELKRKCFNTAWYKSMQQSRVCDDCREIQSFISFKTICLERPRRWTCCGIWFLTK